MTERAKGGVIAFFLAVLIVSGVSSVGDEAAVLDCDRAPSASYGAC